MRSAPSPLQRCFLRSWGSCLLPCSAACAKPRASGHMPHPPFSPVQRSERRSISSCCRRASHRGALPATCLHTAERFAFVLRRPSPLQRHLLEATALGLPAAPPVLPHKALLAQLDVVLLRTCVASRNVAFNSLAHSWALRIRGYLPHPRSPPCSATGTALSCCCRRASHRGALLSTRWRTAEHCAFALRRRHDEKILKRKGTTWAPTPLQVYVRASLRVCVWSCGRPPARNSLLVTPSPVQH